MDYIVRPKVRATGGRAAGGQEDWQDRLVKYIPLSIAGAYPLLENAINQYVAEPIAGLSPQALAWVVFGLLTIWYVLFLGQKFKKTNYNPKTRRKLQIVQTLVSILAFCVWTYSVKSTIWHAIYHPALAILATVLFVLFASLYAAPIEPEDVPGHQ